MRGVAIHGLVLAALAGCATRVAHPAAIATCPASIEPRAPGADALEEAPADLAAIASWVPLGAVDVRGDGPPWVRDRMRSLGGALDEPVRTERLRRRMVASLVNDGYRDAAIDTARTGRGLCVAIRAGRRYRIDRIAIAGNGALPAALIERVIERELGRINARGGVYREDLLQYDRDELLRLYADRGYVDAQIAAPVARYDDARGAVSVALAITPGPLYRFGAVTLTGDVDDPAAYRKLVGVTAGQTFARRELAIGLADLEAVARQRGADVETSTHVDRDRGTVDVELTFRRRGDE